MAKILYFKVEDGYSLIFSRHTLYIAVLEKFATAKSYILNNLNS